jgi:hypothetical protein
MLGSFAAQMHRDLNHTPYIKGAFFLVNFIGHNFLRVTGSIPHRYLSKCKWLKQNCRIGISICEGSFSFGIIGVHFKTIGKDILNNMMSIKPA